MTDILSDISEVIARYFWRAVVTFLLVTGAVGASLLGGSNVYEARTLLLFQLGRYYVYVPDSSLKGIRTPSPGDLELFVNAEMLILNSSQLRNKLIDRLGLANIYPDLVGNPKSGQLAAESLAEAISIKLVTGSHVLDMRVRHRNSNVAARIATTLVDLYMERRAEIFAPAAAAYLRMQIVEAERQVSATEAGVNELLGGDSILSYETGLDPTVAALTEKDALIMAEIEKIKRRRQQIAGLYDQLRNTEVTQTLAAGGRSSVRIIEPATPPARPTGPPKLVRLIVSMLLGAIVAAGWVLVAFLRHQNMISPSMVRARLNLPVLGEIEDRMDAGSFRPSPRVLQCL